VTLGSPRKDTQNRSRAALRAARRELHFFRRMTIEGGSIGMTGRRRDVKDPGTLDALARLDRLIARLDEAIVFFGAQ
jgi:hypothetical protein